MTVTRTYRIAAGAVVLAGATLGLTSTAQADPQPWTVTPVQAVEAPAASPSTAAPWTSTDTRRVPQADSIGAAAAAGAVRGIVDPAPEQPARAASASTGPAVLHRTHRTHRAPTVARVAQRAQHTTPARPRQRVASGAHTSGTWHVVQGETLSQIASLNRTTVGAIVRANHHAHPSITPNHVVAGWTLRLPGGAR